MPLNKNQQTKFKTQKMKTNNFLYIISLIALAIAVLLIIEYPASGRTQLIAGGLTAMGFLLNIVGYTLKKR